MGILKMSTKERRRMELLSRVGTGLKLAKVAEVCKLSYRQMKRVWKRYREEGDAGLVHRSRGRASNRRIEGKARSRILERYAQRYADFGPTLASEYLATEGMRVDHETLRRWLLETGGWTKKRRRQKHRQWRLRRGHRGEMVQMDGSHHDWFEGRRAWAVLMVMVDDATGRVWARFYESEEARAAFDIFGRYARRWGLPLDLYVDRDSIYKCTREARIDEELEAECPQTQFGRAMKQLGITLILANSPQAKGRVERCNGVLQDRLVKALRLEGIATLEAANRFLEKRFLPEMNRRFSIPAREPQDLHRGIPPGVRLADVLCFEEPRVVQKDWTIRWRHRYFQVERQHEALCLAGRSVIVRERLDGTLCVLYGGLALRFRELPSRPSPPPRRPASTPSRSSAPAATHPWKRYPAVGRPARRTSSDELWGPFSEARRAGLPTASAAHVPPDGRGHF